MAHTVHTSATRPRRRPGRLAGLLAVVAIAVVPAVASASPHPAEEIPGADATAWVVTCEYEGSCSHGGGPVAAPQPVVGELVPTADAPPKNDEPAPPAPAPEPVELTEPVAPAGPPSDAAPAPAPSMRVIAIQIGGIRIGTDSAQRVAVEVDTRLPVPPRSRSPSTPPSDPPVHPPPW